MVIKERIRESDSLFPTIFHVAQVVFSSVGAEMLTGGSVGVSDAVHNCTCTARADVQ